MQKDAYKPKFLEKWAQKKFHKLNEKQNNTKILSPYFLIFLAFLVGFIFSIPLVLIDMYYSMPIEMFSSLWFQKWGLVGFWSVIASVIEMYLIFKISIYMVHKLTLQYGYDYKELTDSYILGFDFLLSRLVIGVEEPKVKLDGIDAYKYSNKYKTVAKKLLYKVRITLSNAITKILIRRVFIQNGVRINIEWVSAVVIGIWNAIALFLVYQKIKDILEDMKSIDNFFETSIEKTHNIEIYLRIVGNLFVISQTNNRTLQYVYFKLKKLYNKNIMELETDSYKKLEALVLQEKNILVYKNFYFFLLNVANIKNKKLDKLNRLLDITNIQ